MEGETPIEGETPMEGERPMREKKKVRFHMTMEEVEDEGEEQST